MSKIITLPGSMAGAKNQTDFVAELHGSEIYFRQTGKLEFIIQMLFDVMRSQEPAAKTLITTVLIFADQKGIALEDLRKHSYLNTSGNQIITP